MANEEWFDNFPSCRCLGLPVQRSDHGPIIIESKEPSSKYPRPFKLEKFLIDHPDFRNILRDSWTQNWNSNEDTSDSLPISGSHSLAKKLKVLKNSIKEWNNNRVGNIFHQISAIQSSLENLQNNPHFPNNIDEDFILRSHLDTLLLAEDKYWKQR